MHLETNARHPVYYLFTSREKTWALTAFSIINLLVAIKSRFPKLKIANSQCRIPHLCFCHGKSVGCCFELLDSKIQRQTRTRFIALWLFGWAMLWFAPVYSNAELRSVRNANVLVWVVATTIALRILKAANAVR